MELLLWVLRVKEIMRSLYWNYAPKPSFRTLQNFFSFFTLLDAKEI